MANWGTEIRSGGQGGNMNVEWLRKCSVVEQKLRKVQEEVNRIDRAIQSPGTAAQSHTINDQLHNVSASLKQLTSDLVDLETLTSQFNLEGGERKARVRRLQDQALNELRRIQRCSSQMKATVRTKRASTADSYSAEGGGFNGPYVGGYSDENGSKSVQLSRMADPEQAQAEQDARDMERLETDIVQVNEIFTTLAGLVHEQGDLVDSIEANTTSAHIAVSEGQSNLQSAIKSRNAARKKKCILIIVIVVVIAILALAIGLGIGLR